MRFLYENPIYICRSKTNQFVSKQTNKSMKVTKKQYKLLSLPNQNRRKSAKCPHLQNSEEVKEQGIEFFLEKKEIPSVFFY